MKGSGRLALVLLLAVSAALAQYPWPVYPPFNPGSWAWPMYPAMAPPPEPPSPAVTVIYPAPSAPVVVYNETPPRRPARRARPAAQPPVYGSPIYLIAFQDGQIRAAAAYWVEGDTLHYIGRDRAARAAPLDTVDRDLSLQLNRERRVPFRLPDPE
jgi:hypothetical protein